METWKNGARHARDLILCMIIGMSNDSSCIPNSEKDKAYDEVYNAIVNRCGDLFEDWKE